MSLGCLVQLAAKNAAKAAALANAKVTMRITPPSEDDASFADNVSFFLEGARPKLDQVIHQKEAAKVTFLCPEPNQHSDCSL